MAYIDPIVPVLTSFRKSRGMSQDVLASLSGMSIRTLQRLESGETDMKLGQYRRIIEALNITDMDVSMALVHRKHADSGDIASLASSLPSTVRQAVANFLMDLSSRL